MNRQGRERGMLQGRCYIKTNRRYGKKGHMHIYTAANDWQETSN